MAGEEKNGVWGAHHYEIFDDKEEAADRLKELQPEKIYNDSFSEEKQEKPAHIESEPLPCFPAAGKSGYIISTYVDNKGNNKKEIPKGIEKDSVTASLSPPSKEKTTRRTKKCKLSDEEHAKLEFEYGRETLKAMIQKIEDWIEMKADKGYASWYLAIRKWFREDRPVATSRSWSPQPASQVSCLSNQEYAQMGLKKFVDRTTDGWSVSISSVAVGIYKGQAGYDFRFDDPDFKTKLDSILKRLSWK